MSQINWITPAGSISKIAEEEYYEFQLDAYDTSGSALTYKVIAGKLSNGLQLFKTGLIQGIPVIENVVAASDQYSETFTVRATNIYGGICDRTFSITVNSIALPQIIPKNVSLGTFYDGYYLNLPLVALDTSPLAKLTWTVISGELPAGTTLSPSGLLNGYIKPYVTGASSAILGWSIAGWDYIPWDTPTATAQSKNYIFTVQVFDGSSYDETTYSIQVEAKSLLTVDNNQLLTNTTGITVDLDNKHTPYLLTKPQELPAQRQQSNFAFEFVGIDLDGDEIQYNIVSSVRSLFDEAPFDATTFEQPDQSLPPGVGLSNTDPFGWSDSGWLTGYLQPQVETKKTYNFQVQLRKKMYPGDIYEYLSAPVAFTLTVLGDLNNIITWSTPSDLGYIDNGSVSKLLIAGVSSKGKVLNYRLKEGVANPDTIDASVEIVNYTSPVYSRLPQGLQLQADGLIVGRATFEYFTLDSGTTTIDKKATNFDNVYQFTVTASDDTTPGVISNATIIDSKTFVVKVHNYNASPYENIYLRALPSKEQRIAFNNVLNDTTIFPDPLIYRPSDPWFGKAKDIKFLFAAGLQPNLASTYVESMQHNHYNKRINLNNVKTAVALDANFNVRYEVVYIDIVDTESGVSASVDRTSEVKPPYNTTPFTTVYPNSLDNMNSEVTAIGFTNRGAMPDWMLDQQPDGRILGFTRGVVLAYTVPGASELIAYRLRQQHSSFNDVDFVADRYQLDHYLSEFYEIATRTFIPSKEATFDRLPPVGGIHPYAGAVDFALTVPFDEINGRTVEYILRAGGLDGATTIRTGQMVVFAKQENYSTGGASYVKDSFDSNTFDDIGFNLSVDPKMYTTPNEGWNIDGGLYGFIPYDGSSYAPSSIVPGYLDMLVGGLVNERGGIWQVNVSVDNIVTLVFITEVKPYEYVQIGGGQSHGQTKMYYDPIIKPGNAAPEYSALTSTTHAAYDTTRFDGNSTRFYDNRDTYALPETKDVYLKFPKHNIYQ